MPTLGPLERAFLHRQIRLAVRQGQLPQDTLTHWLPNADFHQTLEDAVTGSAVEAAGPTPAPGGHPILQWIIQNLPAIINIVLQLIAAFGGAKPAPVSLMATGGGDKMGFALPPGTGALIAEILQALMPLIEAEIKKHIPTAA